MAGRPEDVIENTVANKAKMAGWFHRKLSYIGRVGAPDRVFIKNGRVVFIEFKAPDEDPKGYQIEEHKRLRAAGAEIHVIDNVRAGLKVLGI